MIRVAVADDHKLVRQMLSQTIAGETDMEFVGEAEDGARTLAVVREHEPEVLVLDMNLPDMTGVQVIRELRKLESQVKILVLTAIEDETYLFESLAAGAQGYLLKDSDVEEVLAAIRGLHEGKAYLHPRSTMSLLTEFQRSRSESVSVESAPTELQKVLTPREFVILELIGFGFSNPEIAARLTISEKTVKTHVSNILRRLNLRSRIAAATLAVSQGMCRSQVQWS